MRTQKLIGETMYRAFRTTVKALAFPLSRWGPLESSEQRVIWSDLNDLAYIIKNHSGYYFANRLQVARPQAGKIIRRLPQ